MNDDLNDGFNQSALVLIALNIKDGPQEMARALKEYLAASDTVLRPGDIDPLFGKIAGIVLQWSKEGRYWLIREFFGELVAILLEHPRFEAISSLTPEKHLMHKFSSLGTMLGVMLYLAGVPTSFTDRPKADNAKRGRG